MKKNFGVYLFACLLVINITAQANNVFEGYGKLPWGSSIESVKKEYSNLVEKTADEDKKTNERLFSQENQTTTRFFRFYSEKLYWARIVYVNPDITTVQAVAERLRESYGKSHDTGTIQEKGEKTTWSKWNMTTSFQINIDFNEVLNNFGGTEKIFVIITYSNPKIRDEITKIAVERKKKEIEF